MSCPGFVRHVADYVKAKREGTVCEATRRRASFKEPDAGARGAMRAQAPPKHVAPYDAAFDEREDEPSPRGAAVVELPPSRSPVDEALEDLSPRLLLADDDAGGAQIKRDDVSVLAKLIAAQIKREDEESLATRIAAKVQAAVLEQVDEKLRQAVGDAGRQSNVFLRNSMAGRRPTMAFHRGEARPPPPLARQHTKGSLAKAAYRNKGR